MKIEAFGTSKQLSEKGRDIILDSLKINRRLLLCAATGSSPTEIYHLLGQEYKNQPDLFDSLRLFKLDEWGGIPMDHPASCELYLRKNLIEPLHIAENRYTGFKSDVDPDNLNAECKRIQNKLTLEGPADICVLGVGANGHIGFNEPAEYLLPHCHVAKLSDASLQHAMVNKMGEKPSYGLTLGMGDILNSRLILLIFQGANKKHIVRPFLSKQISNRLPVSFLWLHSNVICLTLEELIESGSLSENNF